MVSNEEVNKHLSEEQQVWRSQMRSLLAHNVPRFIQRIKDRGGPNDEEFQWLKCEEESADYPMELMNRADELLLYPATMEVFEKSLFVLVLALAIMSFFPTGVEVFGLRFCSEIEDFIEIDG